MVDVEFLRFLRFAAGADENIIGRICFFCAEVSIYLNRVIISNFAESSGNINFIFNQVIFYFAILFLQNILFVLKQIFHSETIIWFSAVLVTKLVVELKNCFCSFPQSFTGNCAGINPGTAQIFFVCFNY